MSKNDRFVVKHPDGWAVKASHSQRASSVHRTQKDAEWRRSVSCKIWVAEKFAFKEVMGNGGTLTLYVLATILTHRKTKSISTPRSTC